MRAGHLSRRVRGALGGAKWLLPIGAALGAAVLGFGGPAPPDDRVLIAAADLRPGLLALAGATDAARDSGDLQLLDQAAAALRARIAIVYDATAGEHPYAHQLAQQVASSLDALLVDAYGYAAGAGTSGAGSTSFNDMATLTGELTRQLVSARDAVAERAAATRLLLLLASSTGLVFGLSDGLAVRRRAVTATRFDAVTGLMRRSALTRELQRTIRARGDERTVFALAIEVETLHDVARTSGLAEADAYFREFVGRVSHAIGGTARLGRGDGYSLIVCGDAQGSGPAELAGALLADAHEPLRLGASSSRSL